MSSRTSTLNVVDDYGKQGHRNQEVTEAGPSGQQEVFRTPRSKNAQDQERELELITEARGSHLYGRAAMP